MHAKSHRSVTDKRTLRGGGPGSARFGMAPRDEETSGNERFRGSPVSCIRAMPQPPATGGMSATSSPARTSSSHCAYVPFTATRIERRYGSSRGNCSHTRPSKSAAVHTPSIGSCNSDVPRTSRAPANARTLTIFDIFRNVAFHPDRDNTVPQERELSVSCFGPRHDIVAG